MNGDSRPRDLSLVRASDLSAWAYCRRAWWLANVQGAEHADPEQLERGRAAHAAHGRAVVNVARMRMAGILLLVAALLLLAAGLAFVLLG